MTKKSLKQYLYTYETNICGIITNSLVHQVPKDKTLDLIKRETSRISAFLGLSRAETHYLWLTSNKFYNIVSKRLFSDLRKLKVEKDKPGYDKILAKRYDTTYETIRNVCIYSGKIEKVKNETANSVEHRIKHAAIFGYDGQIASSRAKENRYSPFFLASAHANPAIDHADWEGKMYYDEDWEDFVQDISTAKRIRAYIKNHNLKSVQWVSGPEGGVYLTTRPNCKHYFKNIPIDEVLSSSTKSLLRSHELYMPDDLPETYEYGQYRKYYERLKVLLKLRKLIISEQLEADIKATKRLLRKWSSRAK